MAAKRVKKLPHLPPRKPGSHKGDFGHVLVVGGSRGMIGAVALATEAALRGGAGLVTFASPETIQLAVAPLVPSALSVPLACNGRGELAPESVSQLLHATKYTVLAVGPGMGQGAGQRNLVRPALEQDKPLVIDADGLNNLVAIDNWPSIRRCPCILTPHPGEFSRLTGKPTKDVQAARERSAVEAMQQWLGQSRVNQPLVLVLKGEGTVVTDGARTYINDTGNAGLAHGGTGDVLTGLIAAFAAQGLTPFDAACLGVWVHGRAGDLAAAKLGQVAMISSDLAEFLPAAIKDATRRGGPVSRKR